MPLLDKSSIFKPSQQPPRFFATDTIWSKPSSPTPQFESDNEAINDDNNFTSSLPGEQSRSDIYRHPSGPIVFDDMTRLSCVLRFVAPISRHFDNDSTPAGPMLHSDTSKYSSEGKSGDDTTVVIFFAASTKAFMASFVIVSFRDKLSLRKCVLLANVSPIAFIPPIDICFQHKSNSCNGQEQLSLLSSSCKPKQSAITPSSPIFRSPIAKVVILFDFVMDEPSN
mmetsp:Transcript_21990/g.32378  ORF Transcript_21990/g.32378 Transcript_21990/m.32378 type:complete len:225 (+) Transcript_21990:653-1327(+)